jgi:hypothetical protein
MGLLDDAIREHLDLKRRRGADPSEIAKEETEALGPVRREAAAGGEAVADAPGAPLEDDDFGPHADDDHGHTTAPPAPEPAAPDQPAAFYDDRALDDPEPAAEPTYAERPQGDYEHLRPRPADPPQTHPDPYAEREDESATPPHGDPLAHQHTREFSATELDEALGAPATPAPAPERAEPPAPDAQPDPDAVDPDDELEDTPDFLQETPEHDRLWFEQKPPKDFDF